MPLGFIRIFAAIALALNLLVNVGCSSGSRGTAPGVVLLVPGVGGDGAWYRNVVPALRDAGERRTIRSIRWGLPGPAFFMNFNNEGVHDRAERALAAWILRYERKHPTETIDILAHSAGGGVTLGALARLPAHVNVRRVVLLHPSVSPAYPLAGALDHVTDHLHVFASTADTTFLSWRTSRFGTYDNVKTQAAGNRGFDVSGLPMPLREKLTQHHFTEADSALGNDGGHFGALARPFLRERVAPIFTEPPAASLAGVEPSRSAAATQP